MSVISDMYERHQLTEKESTIPLDHAEFLYEFLRGQRVKATLETGFGCGASAAAIMLATGKEHYAMDPAKMRNRIKTGLQLIEDLQLQNLLQFEQKASHAVLPELLRQTVTVDFALVDGDHKFDSAFIDFYYVDLLLKKGGYVMVHDVWLPSVERLVSWIDTNKSAYTKQDIPIGGAVLYKKTAGSDKRDWDHFVAF